jgi:hypothetical protein
MAPSKKAYTAALFWVTMYAFAGETTNMVEGHVARAVEVQVLSSAQKPYMVGKNTQPCKQVDSHHPQMAYMVNP